MATKPTIRKRKKTERTSGLSELEGLSFDKIAEISADDRIAVFRGEMDHYRKKGVKLTEDIQKRQALGFEISEHEYDGLVHKLFESLGRGALDRVPSRVRAKVSQAAEIFNRREENRHSYYRLPPFFTAVDDIRTATTLFDGGSFYEGAMFLPGVKIPIRIKKYGDPQKFKRGLPVQRFLRRLERDGIIGQRINQPAVIDDNNGLVAELRLEGKRLTDILREAGSDEERANLLEPTVRDYIEISVKATTYRDLKVDSEDARKVGFDHGHGKDLTDEGEFYLKTGEGILGSLRNRLPGNYIIPTQGDSVDNFLKTFALRSNPHLRNFALDKKGRVNLGRSSGSERADLTALRDGLSSLVSGDYDRRRKFIVNLDANSTQVIVTPDGRRIYSDWDFTYFGLVEEQLVELLLTSGIEDERQISRLVKVAHDHLMSVNPVADPERDYLEFSRVVDKKIVEKLLGRAARFKDVSRKVEDGLEKRVLDDYANKAYTLALRKLDELAETGTSNIEYAGQKIREFNEKYLHLKIVEGTHGVGECDDTIGSIVSTVSDRTPLEGMKSSYRISGEPVNWGRFFGRLKTVAWATPVLGAITLGAVWGSHMGRVEEMKNAALYSGKEISFVDGRTNEPVLVTKDCKIEMPQGKSVRDLVSWAYEIPANSDRRDLMLDLFERMHLEPAPGFIESTDNLVHYDQLEGYVQSAAERSQVDPDMIRAIMYSRGNMGAIGFEGPMKLKMTRYFRDRGYEGADLRLPHHNISAGADYLNQCIRHNRGSLADSFAEYFGGVYNVQRAMIESGSRDYAEYRGQLDSSVIQLTDSAIANYIYFKTGDSAKTSK